MAKEKPTYGRSRSGEELTDEVIERMAADAEAGLDVTKLRRRPGRPRMGSAPAEALPVRFEPELREAIEERAEAEGVSAGEVVRRALRDYLSSSFQAGVSEPQVSDDLVHFRRVQELGDDPDLQHCWQALNLLGVGLASLPVLRWEDRFPNDLGAAARLLGG
jgi:hypothetical protein